MTPRALKARDILLAELELNNPTEYHKEYALSLVNAATALQKLYKNKGKIPTILFEVELKGFKNMLLESLAMFENVRGVELVHIKEDLKNVQTVITISDSAKQIQQIAIPVIEA